MISARLINKPGSLICQSKQLEVSVQDRGVGIPQSEIGHIFEPFYSQQSAGGLKRPGHGIGLSICRNICEKLGGSITVNSLENFGARFTFTIDCDEMASPIEEKQKYEVMQTLSVIDMQSESEGFLQS